tara:strand:- start:15202 stop:17166 length:1965 start_codon:yes stop_codon:yes gene_type:complete
VVYQLHTFGELHLTAPTGGVVAFPEKALVALSYLLTRSNSYIPRQDLADFLWQNCESANPRVNLRQLLLRIKARQKDLDTPIFILTQTDIAVNRAAVECDFSMLLGGKTDQPLLCLQKFLDLVTGEFLSGCELSSEKGGAWLHATRSQILHHVSICLDRAVSGPITDTDRPLIKEAAYRLLELDSYNEAAYKALMGAFAGEGLISQVKMHFHRYKDLLWSDLQALPQSGMIEFAESLFGDRIPARPKDQSASPGDAIEVRPDANRDKPKIPRLLILPPIETSGATGQVQLAQAFVEDITISLCRTRSLAVVAPHTARRLAGKSDDHAISLQRYDVTYALETRLSAETGEATLYATLSDCRVDCMIWAERFPLIGVGLASSYTQLIRRIAASVIDLIERHEFAKARIASNPGAYQHYLIGQNHLNRIDLPSIRRARKSFRAALICSSDYASALSGMARTQHLEWLLLARADTSLLKAAEANAKKAILVDPDDAAGYRVLGVVNLFCGQFDESINVFSTAEQSAPMHADLLADFADTLVHASQPEAGFSKISEAIALNPLCPDIYWWTAAGANFCLEKYETALVCIGKMEDQTAATRLSAACWGMMGDTKRSRALAAKTMDIYPDFEIENWLSVCTFKEKWQRELYREGLSRAGFR